MSLSNLIKTPLSSPEKKIVRLSTVIDPELDALNKQTDPQAVEAALSAKISKAKQKAAEIVKKAEMQRQEFEKKQQEEEVRAEQKRNQAYALKEKEGYEAGFERGSREAAQTYKEKIDQANRLIDQAGEAYREYLRQAEPDILKLSMAVAEKIIGTSVALDEDKWFSLVTKAVREVRDQKTIKIMVSPVHFESVNRHRRLLDGLVHDAKVYIYADGDLPENGCTIETAFGKINAGVDSQLTVIREKLTELMEEDG